MYVILLSLEGSASKPPNLASPEAAEPPFQKTRLQTCVTGTGIVPRQSCRSQSEPVIVKRGEAAMRQDSRLENNSLTFWAMNFQVCGLFHQLHLCDTITNAHCFVSPLLWRLGKMARKASTHLLTFLGAASRRFLHSSTSSNGRWQQSFHWVKFSCSVDDGRIPQNRISHGSSP